MLSKTIFLTFMTELQFFQLTFFVTSILNLTKSYAVILFNHFQCSAKHIIKGLQKFSAKSSVNEILMHIAFGGI